MFSTRMQYFREKRTMTRQPTRPEWLPETAGSTHIQLARLETSQYFEATTCGIILLNLLLLVIQADNGAQCALDGTASDSCQPKWLQIAEHVFLGIYTFEVLFRLSAERWHWMMSKWNLFDAFIVGLGYVDILLNQTLSEIPGPSLSILRTFRILRLIRAIRVVKHFPELYVMLRGFVGAMKSMFWGFVLILGLLVLWSILCVEMMNPVNVGIDKHDEEWCADVFLSVWNCMLWFFRTLVAGDSWGACTLPIIERSRFAFLIFALALVSVQLGFMNLILAVIVDNANRAHTEDVDQEMRMKAEKSHLAAVKLKELIKHIDIDDSGTISLSELLGGYKNNRELRATLSTLDIDQADLRYLFWLMDKDETGELDYESLSDHIQQAISSDTRKQLMMMRLEAQEISQSLKFLSQFSRLAKGPTDSMDASTAIGSMSAPMRRIPRKKDVATTSQIPEFLNDALRSAGHRDLTRTIHASSQSTSAYGDEGCADVGQFLASIQTTLDRQLASIGTTLSQQMKRLEVDLTGGFNTALSRLAPGGITPSTIRTSDLPIESSSSIEPSKFQGGATSVRMPLTPRTPQESPRQDANGSPQESPRREVNGMESAKDEKVDAQSSVPEREDSKNMLIVKPASDKPSLAPSKSSHRVNSIDYAERHCRYRSN